jgi:hypothetical protein
MKGNFITDRSTTRVHAPPGGRSTFSFSHEDNVPTPVKQAAAATGNNNNSNGYASSQQQSSSTTTSSNAFASGANQNSGTF